MATRKRNPKRARKLPKRAPKTKPKRSKETREKPRTRAKSRPALPLMLTVTAPTQAKAERYHDYDDTEVETTGEIAPDYRPYRHIEDLPSGFDRVKNLGDYLPERWEGLRELDWADPEMKAAWQRGEIEWLPSFDEVYDYIDALVAEYDLDAHELFELAFGYSGSDQAVA